MLWIVPLGRVERGGVEAVARTHRHRSGTTMLCFGFGIFDFGFGCGFGVAHVPDSMPLRASPWHHVAAADLPIARVMRA